MHLQHCKRLAPAWKELSDQYKDSTSIKVAHVDCTTDKQICSNAGVRRGPACTSILARGGGALGSVCARLSAGTTYVLPMGAQLRMRLRCHGLVPNFHPCLAACVPVPLTTPAVHGHHGR